MDGSEEKPPCAQPRVQLYKKHDVRKSAHIQLWFKYAACCAGGNIPVAVVAAVKLH
jgi:hypothetical protein